MNIEFEEFGKIPRLKREITITEKIDGTNAQILIAQVGGVEGGTNWDHVQDYSTMLVVDGTSYIVMFGSRNKYIKIGDDNAGFAAWATPKAEEFVRVLGEGRHYGEWWGKGIQRNYGMDCKRLSLFNTHRWSGDTLIPLRDIGIDVVPVLYQGPMMETQPFLERLRIHGSFAAPGFMNPEGIIVYHSAGRTYFKETLDKDDQPKGQT